MTFKAEVSLLTMRVFLSCVEVFRIQPCYREEDIEFQLINRPAITLCLWLCACFHKSWCAEHGFLWATQGRFPLPLPIPGPHICLLTGLHSDSTSVFYFIFINRLGINNTPPCLKTIFIHDFCEVGGSVILVVSPCDCRAVHPVSDVMAALRAVGSVNVTWLCSLATSLRT